jgi:SAM-dependent methyltransferase
MSDDQLDFYSTVERDYWATAWGSKPDEAAVLERYLAPGRSTVEAGTGNGRMLFQLRERGFAELAGFDFVPDLIEAARATPGAGDIELEVADARSVPYADERFGQAIYLSQIPSLFEAASDRAAVVREAHRILEHGGRAVFSFLSYDVRRSDWRYRPFLAYLGALRRVRRSGRARQLLPRLRTSGTFSAGALRDQGPHMYWYRTEEAEAELLGAGFRIEAIGTTPQVLAGEMAASAAELDGAEQGGTLYAICRKP